MKVSITSVGESHTNPRHILNSTWTYVVFQAWVWYSIKQGAYGIIYVCIRRGTSGHPNHFLPQLCSVSRLVHAVKNWPFFCYRVCVFYLFLFCESNDFIRWIFQVRLSNLLFFASHFGYAGGKSLILTFFMLEAEAEKIQYLLVSTLRPAGHSDFIQGFAYLSAMVKQAGSDKQGKKVWRAMPR